MGSGSLAWEQEGGKHESGKAFLMTVAAIMSPPCGTNVNHHFDFLIPFSLQVLGRPIQLPL